VIAAPQFFHGLPMSGKNGFIYNTGPELEFFLLKPTSEGRLIPPRHRIAPVILISLLI